MRSEAKVKLVMYLGTIFFVCFLLIYGCAIKQKLTFKKVITYYKGKYHIKKCEGKRR
jgi:hypothetical protein